MISNYNQP